MQTQRAVRLLQLTDTHLLGRRDALLYGICTYDTLQATLADAEKRYPGHEGILLTGDLVHDDATGYALIREMFSDSQVPVYCIPGNHDLPDAMRQMLTDSPFILDTHCILHNWLVVLLDSTRENHVGGRLGPEQLQHLDVLLQQHPQHHTLICLHHHPIKMQSQWLDEIGLADGQAFHECIQRHQQVRGVLWGHVHQPLDKIIEGVHYMATPSTCAQFLQHSEEFTVAVQPPGYRTLELCPDGTIRTEVIRLESE